MIESFALHLAVNPIAPRQLPVTIGRAFAVELSAALVLRSRQDATTEDEGPVGKLIGGEYDHGASAPEARQAQAPHPAFGLVSWARALLRPVRPARNTSSRRDAPKSHEDRHD